MLLQLIVVTSLFTANLATDNIYRNNATPTSNRGRSLLEKSIIHKDVKEEYGDTYLLNTLNDVALDRTIVLTLANCGFLDFANNWIIHAERLGNMPNILMIAEDEQSYTYLQRRIPGHVIHANQLVGARNGNTNKASDIGSLGFYKITCNRSLYIQKILSIGFTVLNVDIDAPLLENPFGYIPKLYDFVGSHDYFAGVYDEWEQFTKLKHNAPQKSHYICTCFMYMRPTEAVKALMDTWIQKCNSGSHDAKTHDQILFNEALHEAQASDMPISVYLMPIQLLPEGKSSQQFYHPQVRGLDNKCEFWMRPLWVHANYIVGRKHKKQFLQYKHAWQYGNETFPTCD